MNLTFLLIGEYHRMTLVVRSFIKTYGQQTRRERSGERKNFNGQSEVNGDADIQLGR